MTKNTLGGQQSAVSSQQNSNQQSVVGNQQEGLGTDTAVLQSGMPDNQKSKVSESRITQYESRTRITGIVEVRDDFPADFSVVADPVYVQHYPKLLLGSEYPVDGEIRGELKLDGTLVNLDGSANFRVTGRRCMGYPFGSADASFGG